MYARLFLAPSRPQAASDEVATSRNTGLKYILRSVQTLKKVPPIKRVLAHKNADNLFPLFRTGQYLFLFTDGTIVYKKSLPPPPPTT